MLVGGFDGCKRCVSRVFRGCFAGVSRVFRGFHTGCFTSFAAVSQLFRAVSQRIRVVNPCREPTVPRSVGQDSTQRTLRRAGKNGTWNMQLEDVELQHATYRRHAVCIASEQDVGLKPVNTASVNAGESRAAPPGEPKPC